MSFQILLYETGPLKTLPLDNSEEQSKMSLHINSLAKSAEAIPHQLCYAKQTVGLIRLF